MDPTLQMAGAMGAPAGAAPPATAQGSALKNALLLQAIKGDASGGATPPMGQTQAATGMQQMPSTAGGMQPPMPSPMAPPQPPVNPAAMQGGMGTPPMAGATPPMGMQTPMMQAMGGQPTMQGTDPVTSALFSPIPGAQ